MRGLQSYFKDLAKDWGILIPKPGSPSAGETVHMHGGAIFGFQSVIERIRKEKELTVLLDNTDSLKLLEMALGIRHRLFREAVIRVVPEVRQLRRSLSTPPAE